MSTIPGGCFVAPDSLRRLKQHAREANTAKTQQGMMKPPIITAPTGLPPLPPSQPGTLPQIIKTAPMRLRLSEIFRQSRSASSSPMGTPPGTPPLSPLIPRSPPHSPILIPKAQSAAAKEIASFSESI